MCGGWPYHGNSNDKVPINVPVLLVTSDFDYKYNPDSLFR